MRFLIVLMLMGRLQAADFNQGQQKSATCEACHGKNGISANSLWPNLAGQKDQYLAEQLRDFRDGRRTNQLMSPIAKMLSDQDIEDLVFYFSKLGSP